MLGSGRGSNLSAIADACESGAARARIAIVLSDVPDAGILSRAQARGLPAQFVPPGPYRTKLDENAERAFIDALRQAEVDLVVLAGFMRILKGDFLRAFPQKVVNIHPSLLPAFPGLEAWKQALEHGVKVTGCTVHLVDQGVDTGAILGQDTVPVFDSDTAATLHERIQRAEHNLYPAVIAAWADGRIRVEGRVSRWAPRPADLLA